MTLHLLPGLSPRRIAQLARDPMQHDFSEIWGPELLTGPQKREPGASEPPRARNGQAPQPHNHNGE